MSKIDWQMVLGFEIHVELATVSKMFCGCPADHFGKEPNTQTCPVCLGLPGALPVPNSKAIEWCVKLGMALNCRINLKSRFDRKNYFYPDLPKGYQISQHDQPFCQAGFLQLSSGKKIRITRVHMEEDTGKLQHAELAGKKITLIDFNRSGVPLVEIVTEPDFDNLDQATEFLKEMQLIVRTLGISAADMEKGSMRLEANVSVRPKDQKQLPDYKVEIKNVNSFRFIRKAIEFEVRRQIEMLESGKIPLQETRGFKESTGKTHAQRGKEEAQDYRYFPEPDIPPFQFQPDQIQVWRNELPELPSAARAKLQAMGISASASQVLVSSPARLAKFQEIISKHPAKIKQVADLLVNTPEDKVPTVEYTENAKFSNELEITRVASEVIRSHPEAVATIKSGKQQAAHFLVGQIKKRLGVSIDVPLTLKILARLISQLD